MALPVSIDDSVPIHQLLQTLRDNLVTSGTATPLADLPAGFFHALIVSRFDALEPPEQTVLKAGTGEQGRLAV